MAALRGFLHKTYDNLILVDYICRGIASPLLFRKYIEYLENKHHSKVVYFKAKTRSWDGVSILLKFSLKIEMSNIKRWRTIRGVF